jgi:hypothetical protein
VHVMKEAALWSGFLHVRVCVYHRVQRSTALP